MKYKVVSYCPDRHIEYDGETPYKTGVGGGVTARVRMAKALAQLGHDVTMAVNCREERWIDGVHYMPLDQFRSYDGDIAILNTSGVNAYYIVIMAQRQDSKYISVVFSVLILWARSSVG